MSAREENITKLYLQYFELRYEGLSHERILSLLLVANISYDEMMGKGNEGKKIIEHSIEEARQHFYKTRTEKESNQKENGEEENSKNGIGQEKDVNKKEIKPC